MRYGNDYGAMRPWSRRGMGYDAGRGYDAEYGRRGAWSGMDRAWTERDRDEEYPRRHRFFGRWANEDTGETWESDRHGVGRYAADPRALYRGGERWGRGYGTDFHPGRMRGYDRGWEFRRGYDRGW